MKTNKKRSLSLLIASLMLLSSHQSLASTPTPAGIDGTNSAVLNKSAPAASEPCSPSAAAKELYQITEMSRAREFEVVQHIGSLREDVREKISGLQTAKPAEYQKYLKRFQIVSGSIDAGRLDLIALCQIETAFGPTEIERYVVEAKADAHKAAADEKFIGVLKAVFENMSATIKSAALELTDIKGALSAAQPSGSNLKTGAPASPVSQDDPIELQRAWCDGRRSNVPGHEGFVVAALRATGCTAIITAKDEAVKSRATAFFKRAVAYNEMLKDELALADFNEVIRLDPANAKAFYERGFIHHRNQEQDRAIADFTSALDIDPKYSGAYYGRGGAYSAKGLYKKAIADFDRAIKLEPTFAGAFNSRGVVYRNMGQDQRGQADFDHAARLEREEAAAECAKRKAKAESC